MHLHGHQTGMRPRPNNHQRCRTMPAIVVAAGGAAGSVPGARRREDSERWAKLRLLEQEQEAAIDLAQTCSKRSKRLLARVQQLTLYAEQRQRVGDQAAVESTARTKEQVQGILNKTITRAHNNYNLAVRLGDMIGYLQQELSQPGAHTSSRRQRIQPVFDPDSEAQQEAPPPSTQQGIMQFEEQQAEQRLLMGSAAQAALRLVAVQGGEEEEEVVEEEGGGEGAFQRAVSCDPGGTAWTSVTLSSVDWGSPSDWGMDETAWAEMVDSPLAAALSGREPLEVVGSGRDGAGGHDGAGLQGGGEVLEEGKVGAGTGDEVPVSAGEGLSAGSGGSGEAWEGQGAAQQLTSEALQGHDELAFGVQEAVDESWLEAAREAAYAWAQEQEHASIADALVETQSGLQGGQMSVEDEAGKTQGGVQGEQEGLADEAGKTQGGGEWEPVANAVRVASGQGAEADVQQALDDAIEFLRQRLGRQT